MRLGELHAANDLLDDPGALAARFEQEGCLLVRGGIDPTALATITEQASSVLQRAGVAQRQNGLRWTGAAVGHLDDTRINDIPALNELVDQIDHGHDPLRPAAQRVCAHPMHIWRYLRIFAAIPDDPAHVTVPHQDGFAVTATGDYRRIWIALTEIPFGDGGLGLALASHHQGRLPHRQLPEFTDRPSPGQSSPPQPRTAILDHVCDLSAGLGLSQLDVYRITADLTRADAPINEDTVRAAARGDYTRT